MNALTREADAWGELIASMPMSEDARAIRGFARYYQKLLGRPDAHADILALDPSGWSFRWNSRRGWWIFMHPDAPATWARENPPGEIGFSISSRVTPEMGEAAALAEFISRYPDPEPDP